MEYVFENSIQLRDSLNIAEDEDKRVIYGGFLKWWYPTTMGFPTKNDHLGLFWGYHHLRKHPYTLKAQDQTKKWS